MNSKTGLAAVVMSVSMSLMASLPDPIAWWKMDALENGKIADSSGNGRDLTVASDCSISGREFVRGVQTEMQALYLPANSNSWATFSCPALTSRTLSMWVWREDGEGPLDASVNSIPYLCTAVSSLNIECSRGNAFGNPWYSGNTSAEAVYPKVYLYFTRKVWQHLVVVVDITGVNGDGTYNGSQTLYVNGVKKAHTTPIAFPSALARSQTGILGNNYTYTRPLHCYLGECMLYNTALTAQQVEELYQNTARGQLLVHWDMESITEISGTRYIAGTDTSSLLQLGNAVTITNGIDGKALLLNPVDAQSLSDSWAASAEDGRHRCSSATFSLWFNIDPTIGDTTSIITSNGGYNNIPNLWRDGGSTRLMINSGGGLDKASTRLDVFLAGEYATTMFNNGYVEKGRWSHITVTGNIVEDPTSPTGRKGYANIYVNGEAISSTIAHTNVKTEAFNDSVIYIGCAAKGGGPGNIRVLKGMIDDFRVYQGVLTPDEIRAIYRGPAAVFAGDDFTVASETATLRGTVGDSAKLPYRKGFAGDIRWELVFAPAGGEGAKIETPKSAVTRVTLPAEGTYRFRLVSTAMSVSRSSEVEVVRTAASANNVAPTVALANSVTFPFHGLNALSATVSDPDAGPGTLRVSWKKMSGPGGVWFEPATSNVTDVSFSAVGTYVLRCTAEDGQDASSADVTVTVEGDGTVDANSITNGMFAYYPFTSGATTSFVAGANSVTMSGFRTSQHFEPTPDGLGYRGYGFKSFASLGVTGLGESGINETPAEKWRTVSLWMYHDAANPGTNVVWNPPVFYQRCAVDIMYHVQADGGDHGFQVFQAWGGNTYGMPAKDPANRWTHVCALLDRQCEYGVSDESELWVDGVKMTPTSIGWGKGRSYSTSVCIGGADPNSTANHSDGAWLDPNGQPYSRTFPGIIDEVRLYNRKLTADEIRYLASHPVIDANKAPCTSIPECSGRIRTRKPIQVAVTAHDDEIPYDSSLTYRWEVVSGDAADVVLSSPDARSTNATFTKKGEYVLQLAVSDGERTTYSDRIPITVEAAGLELSFR